jgi:hypothetical protein
LVGHRCGIEMLTGQLYLMTAIGLQIGKLRQPADADVSRAPHQAIPALETPRAREHTRRSKGDKS